MDSPTVNASNLDVNGDGTSTLDVFWTNGNGSSRVVVAKDITGNTSAINFSTYPIDGTDYVGNSQFGAGEHLGDNTFVVYNGTGSSVSITNLDASKRYAIRVYEYTKNANNGNNALYLLGNAAERESALGVEDLDLSASITLYPTITSEILNVEVTTFDTVAYTLFDLQGRTLSSHTVKQGENQVDVSTLSGGLYLISFAVDGKKMTARFIKK